jgi:abhydrolase domain-containing protein 17
VEHYSGRDPDHFKMAEAIAVSWRLIQVLMIVYALVTVGAHFYSISVLFQPGYGSRAEPDGVRYIPQPGGGALAAVYLPNPAAKYTVWFFHGNAEALGDLAPFLHAIQAQGYAVFAVDYPGYGRSSGSPSEQSIYAATAIGARYLQNDLHVPFSRVIVYGRSLGGGPAVELAAREPVAGLVLQSAFTSVYRVITHWPLLPFDKFENLNKLPLVSCPVLVMHGKLDRVVPFQHGPALFEAARGKKTAFWVDDAGHNNFVQAAGARYWEELKKFSDSLR